jgi:hypothetical protein
MEPEGSLPCQCPPPEPDESNSPPHNLFLFDSFIAYVPYFEKIE